MPIVFQAAFLFTLVYVLWHLFSNAIFTVKKFICFVSQRRRPSHPETEKVLNSRYGHPKIWAYPGIYVRSRAEKTIAETLARMKIEFEYEAPIVGPDGRRYFPDFTVFVGQERFFLEHFGLMDRLNYAQKAKEKTAWFDTFFPGQLFVTKHRLHALPRATRQIVKNMRKRSRQKLSFKTHLRLKVLPARN